MRYGYFDVENREYVIDKVNLPVSWTNYIGTKDMCGVFNHTAGGYLFYKSPEYHRVSRFRPNGVPMDGPGHYVYLRDNETGDYWSVSWQPVGKPLDEATYSCRHGFSYSKYACDYNGIFAEQKLFVAEDDSVEIWDVIIKNNGTKKRSISLYSYVEFSFHHIDMDNRNFQMSLYAAGSKYEDGVIEHDLYYEENGYQYFASNFSPDGYDCVRDDFIGQYRTEKNPIAVENGACSNSSQTTGNHCGCLQKNMELEPGQEIRVIFLLGEGDVAEGKRIKEKYSNFVNVDNQFDKLKRFWDKKCNQFQIETPSEGLNKLTNQWTLYQSEINVMFSRFSSFVEVGGRTGLGYRDTAQDAMCIPHSNPEKCRQRIVELLKALTTKGYGLHLFEPIWFEENADQQSFESPTVVPKPDRDSFVHGIEDACADDALWLIGAIVNYIKETGEVSLVDEIITYADDGKGSVYEHMIKILNFSNNEVGANGICKGLRADWNDCLNLGGGESAMVSYLLYWALVQFVELAEYLGRSEDAQKYRKVAADVKKMCEEVLWDGNWYIRGITADNRKIGTHSDQEGKIHLESNTWAVLSGVASKERAKIALESMQKHLMTDYGLMLNAPPYTKPDDSIGFVTRVYPGVKENGAVFSHPNPWAWAAACNLGMGDAAMNFYDSLCPYNQNDKIDIRQSEPYSYCQFIYGTAHKYHGRARHPFMTGTAGWAYFSSTQYILGIRSDFDGLIVDPCIPKDWKGFKATRKWRGGTYHITVKNPYGVQKGITKILVDNNPVNKLPILKEGNECNVEVIMGEQND